MVWEIGAGMSRRRWDRPPVRGRPPDGDSAEQGGNVKCGAGGSKRKERANRYHLPMAVGNFANFSNSQSLTTTRGRL